MRLIPRIILITLNIIFVFSGNLFADEKVDDQQNIVVLPKDITIVKDLESIPEAKEDKPPDVSIKTTPKALPQKMERLEKEIIAETEKMENLLAKRGKFYEDKDVLEYLNSVETKIVNSANPDTPPRIKVMMWRDPSVNAFSSANGTIYITTGTMARLENEAQLAFLLGHETSHIINKDMVYFTADRQGKTVAYKLFDIVLAPTSVFFGILGDLTQVGAGLLYASSVTGYGRDIEARADSDSLPLALSHGYAASESAGLIKILLNEKNKYQKGIEIFFLMDHPTSEWRIKQLTKITSGKDNEEKIEVVKSVEFCQNVAKVKLYNARLNIKLDRLEHAKDNLQWVLDNSPANPEAHYLAGEIYRLSAEDKSRLRDELSAKYWSDLNKNRKKDELEMEWLEKAEKEYCAAIQSDVNYAEAYKGLGLWHQQKNEKDKAVENLKKYLEINPVAEDKRFVTSLITRLEKAEKEIKK